MDKIEDSIKCINCNISIHSTGSYRQAIKERAPTPIIKSIIRHWVSPHILTENDFICQFCWSAVERAEQIILSQNKHLTVEEIEKSELTKVDNRPHCLMCGRSILRGQTKSIYFLSPTEKEKNAITVVNNSIAAHRKINPDSKLCHRCWQKVKRDEEKSIKKQNDEQNKAVVGSHSESVTLECAINERNTIEMPKYKKISQAKDNCIFPDCTNQCLHTVSHNVQVKTLKDYYIFIPPNSMICETHIKSDNWEKINKDKANVSTFTAGDIEQIFSLVQTKANTDVNFKKYIEG